jgi:hypothetical protein
MLKLQYVGRGMHLEFRHPEYPTPIITSPIQEIRDWVDTSSDHAEDLADDLADEDYPAHKYD